MSKDWTGNSKAIFTTLGASSHALDERQVDDFYATDPIAVEILLGKEKFSKNVWEVACGAGHMSKVLEKAGYNVRSTDLVYRGYGEETELDFLLDDTEEYDGDIITNPPYKYGREFVEKAINVVGGGHKVAMFLKLQFLESSARRKLFDKYPPKIVYVFSKRIKCAKNGDFDLYPSSAVAYAWFVWEKGFVGEPVIRWID